MSVLVTGGAGFIGSHTAVVLQRAGFDLVVVDDLSNSSAKALERVAEISGRACTHYPASINDKAALRQIFKEHTIDAVIHFAGFKAVGESVAKPLEYYRNNVAGTLSLLEVMQEAGVHRLVFSSSATVYGDPQVIPIPETASLQATNPYGRSKLMVEEMLTDLVTSAPQTWSVTLLRYFNPIGAHPSGTIGEDPNGIPNNLVPYVAQVASGKFPHVNVYGDDYPTADGTGVRDYIHVMDLAEGHSLALTHLNKQGPGLNVFNLGTGQGYSVMEIIEAFRRVSGQAIPARMAPRRAGDIATCFADVRSAREVLGWSAERNLDTMIEDAWRWQRQNPNGYKD